MKPVIVPASRTHVGPHLFLAASVFALAAAVVRSVEPGREVTAPHRLVQNGVTIEFSMHPASRAPTPGAFHEGDDVLFRFAMHDTAGAPLRGARPAAWMDLRPEGGQGSPSCKVTVQELLSGSIFRKAELDLNVFYVLALNDDATITVVDPLFGFGSTKLLALVRLESPGEDWVSTNDGERLFVSLPGANQVAVVGTTSWQVETSLAVATGPARLAMQPDEQYLWVSFEADGRGREAGGVEVFTTSTLKSIARITTGGGPHDVAISDDSRYAVVTNRDSGTVSVIDVRRLVKTADL
jgi:hypothetical protein